MLKSIFSFVICIFAVQVIMAQKNDLYIKKDDNKELYLVHKVVARENFFSIGRLYNVTPKAIAAFNKLDMNKGLNIDQKIRIPLTDSNFTQQGNAGTPIYHKIGDNDALLKISNEYKNVSLQNLRSWNKLSGDKINKGDKLIVGFLQLGDMASVNNKPAEKTEPPVVKTEEKTIIKEPETIKTADPEKEVKTETKTDMKNPDPVITKEEIKPKTDEQGYFKTSFQQQVKINPVSKNETVTSGIFLTTSGWKDAKYYLLMDRVQPGTIVKLINPSTNSAIYAKVLGEMSGIRQNEGLNIRISNAAATALQINEQDKFIVKLSY